MATNVGIIFAEIGIDYTPATRAQQQLLKDATQTSLNIEQNFKNLGIKSSAEFDLMRQKITNSFDMIKNSSKATTQDILRAEEAKNAKLKALNEEQFGKQKSFLEDAKSNWKAYAATILAAGYAAQQFVDASLKMERITSTMNAVTGSSEGTAAAMSYVRTESQRLGLNLETTALSFGKFMASAKNTSLEGEGTRKVFTSVSEAVAAMKLPAEQAEGIFLALSQMLSKGKVQAEELRGQLGERLPGAFRLAADAMGVSTAELDKMLKDGKIIAEDLLPKLADQLHQTYGVAAVQAAEGGQAAFNRMSNAIFESKAAIGDAFMPVLADLATGFSKITPYITAFIGGLKMTMVEIFGFADATGALVKSIFTGALFGKGGYDDLMSKVSSIRKTMAETKEQIYRDIDNVSTAHDIATKKATSSTQELSDEAKKSYKEITETIRKNSFEVEALFNDQTEKEIANILQKVDEYQKAGVDQVKIQEYVNSEMLKIDIKTNDEITKNAINTAKQKSDIATKQQKDSLELSQKSIDNEKKNSEQRVKMERDLYKDIRGYATESYEATIALINEQAAKYKEAGVSSVAIAAWVAQETERAYIKMAEKSDSFMTGVSAGLLKLQQNMMTWGRAGIEMVATFASSATSSMSSLFFDAAKGQLKDLGDYFKSFWDSMLKKLTDILAQMLTEWILFGDRAKANGGLMGALGLTSLIPTTSSAATTAATVAGASTAAGAATSAATAAAGGLSLTDTGISYAAGFADTMFGTATGAAVGNSLSAIATYAPYVGAFLLADQFLLGGAITNFVTDLIGGIFGGSNAGFGSATHTVDSEGAYGGLPDFGTWFTLAGAKEAAPTEAINALMSDSKTAVTATYQKIADYANALPDAQRESLASALASTTIKYLPPLTDVTWGDPTTAFNITRENVGMLEGYVKSIPAYILSQVNPIIEGITGGAVSARTGLDYVPYDNFLVNTHKGEAVITAEENKKRKGGFDGIIKVYLDGQEIPGRVKVIADGVVVERNRRGVSSTARVYQ